MEKQLDLFPAEKDEKWELIVCYAEDDKQKEESQTRNQKKDD